MESFELRSATLRMRRAWLLVAFYAWTLLGGTLGTSVVLSVPWLRSNAGFPGALVFICGVQIALAVLHLGWRSTRVGTLRLTAGALTLDGRPVVARTSIRQAVLSASAGRPLVRLVRRAFGRNVDVFATSESDARALLVALGFDTSRRAARFRVALVRARTALLLQVPAYALVALAAAEWIPISHTPQFLVAYAAGMLWMVAAIAWSMGTLTVGADGVLVRRHIGTKRFVRYADLKDVAADGRTITLHLLSGAAIQVHVGAGGRSKWLAAPDANVNATALAQRIEDARRARGAGSASASALLARGGRNVARWLAALRGTIDERASFRVPALPEDELWRVALDPSSPPTARAGAAWLLRPRLDGPARRRLRVAGEACAASELRMAFAAAADAKDDAVVAEALARVEDASQVIG